MLLDTQSLPRMGTSRKRTSTLPRISIRRVPRKARPDLFSPD